MDEDDDDMFTEETQDANTAHISVISAVPQAAELDISMMDNWDDPEVFYNVLLGEVDQWTV